MCASTASTSASIAAASVSQWGHGKRPVKSKCHTRSNAAKPGATRLSAADKPRPYVVDGALAVATVMSATGSFDHRAIDGADGAQLMGVFKALVENPLGLVA